MQDKLNNHNVRTLDLIRYKYGKITGVKFNQGKKLRAMDYEAY